jgi:catechol 2,3-dioxygenase-like lactoylglutathione lyase family enzyme
MANSSDQLRIMDIHAVGVPVSDQSRSLDFYVGKLGFEKRLDVPFGDARWLEVAPRGAATSIALVSASPGAPIGVDTGIRISTADAESDHTALLAEGVDADAAVMRMGDFVPPMFTFRDPDGNRLVIVEQTESPAPRASAGVSGHP